ncbi:hypothetical protein NKJ04_17385 [Mesorhizobium sp. M0618]|uniref:hypothetical protein n=1 Tax=Mesorhizobium sp. M0618 TaxID=2956972 RepID=UPI00333B3342
MSPKTEKFIVGFLGTILLAGVCLAIVALEIWMFETFGFIPGVIILIIAVALFAGFMHASTPAKAEEPSAE